MAKTGISPVLLIGLGTGALYLFSSHSAASNLPIPTGTNAAILPNTGTGNPVYGINNGYGGVSNYQQLLQLNPNLGNPNYQMTAAENAQYLSNYLDLQQGLPNWIGHKQHNGVTPQNLQQAAQAHWSTFGCAEKRIFLPFVPPSNTPYVPPPVNQASSGGGSFLSGALKVVGAALPYVAALLGPGQTDPKLNDGDLQLLFTGGKIVKDILPMFADADHELAQAIDQQFTAALTPYI